MLTKEEMGRSRKNREEDAARNRATIGRLSLRLFSLTLSAFVNGIKHGNGVTESDKQNSKVTWHTLALHPVETTCMRPSFHRETDGVTT